MNKEHARKIEFRGQDIETKKWVYGYLIAADIMRKYLNGGRWIEVIVNQETIGQFTGLLDKNGVKIFEGDLTKIKLPAGGFWGNVKLDKTGEVFYEPECGGFIVKWEYSQHQHHETLGCDIAYSAEVIGNIHETIHT